MKIPFAPETPKKMDRSLQTSTRSADKFVGKGNVAGKVRNPPPPSEPHNGSYAKSAIHRRHHLFGSENP